MSWGGNILNLVNACKSNKIIYTYSCLIAFLPIMSIYASGIPGLTLGDLCLLLFLIYSVLNRNYHHSFSGKKSVKIWRLFIIIIFYYSISFLCSILLQYRPPVLDMSVRILRFMFYVIILLEVSKKYFDYQIASKWIIRISIIATLYVILQYLLYYRYSYILPGYLKIIPIYLNKYSLIDYATSYKLHFFRATSFFLEPAHYAQYAVVGLAIALFKQTRFQFRSIIVSIVISLGIVLSTSIQGIIITAVLWIIWIPYIYKKSENKNGLIKFFLSLILLSLVGYFILDTNIVHLALSRLITSEANMESVAYNARFGCFKEIYNLTGIYRIIGMGFGQVPRDSWMSSAAYIWYGTGTIGLIVTLYLLIRCYLLSHAIYSKLICLIYLMLFWSASIFNSYMFVYYLSFICFGFKESICQKEEEENRVNEHIF